MRGKRYSWVVWTGMIGLIAAIALIAVGTGGLGLLLLIPLALVFDVGLLKGVTAGIRGAFRWVRGKTHA